MRIILYVFPICNHFCTKKVFFKCFFMHFVYKLFYVYKYTLKYNAIFSIVLQNYLFKLPYPMGFSHLDLKQMDFI
jgi:hypothetical protein